MAGNQLRGKVAESLASLRDFDRPLDEADFLFAGSPAVLHPGPKGRRGPAANPPLPVTRCGTGPGFASA